MRQSAARACWPRCYAECVYSTTRPGTPEAVLNPTTHLTFSYATQVVILDEDGAIDRVVVANDVGRAINPRLCAEQMEGGVHMASATRCPDLHLDQRHP